MEGWRNGKRSRAGDKMAVTDTREDSSGSGNAWLQRRAHSVVCSSLELAF